MNTLLVVVGLIAIATIFTGLVIASRKHPFVPKMSKYRVTKLIMDHNGVREVE